jgi:hypothetical protein
MRSDAAATGIMPTRHRPTTPAASCAATARGIFREETTASARTCQLQRHETLPPRLDKNIVCGNSLIGTDILDGHPFECESFDAVADPCV